MIKGIEHMYAIDQSKLRESKTSHYATYKIRSENPLQFLGSSNAGIPRLTAIAAKSTQGPSYTDHSPTSLASLG